MFGWTHPKCPVHPELKLWIERRMAWLTDRFGWDYLAARRVVLPSDEYFPDRFDPTDQGARLMLDRLCGYMEVNPNCVDLYLHTDPSASELIAGPHAAGLYEESNERHVVSVDERHLQDPGVLAATMTHELAHAILLSRGYLHGAEPDHEPLTDLFTVFQGLGILTANAFLRDTSYRFGNWEGWRISRLGYLGFDAFSYALALFAWVREERNNDWDRSLRSDVRAFFQRGRDYLEKTQDSTFSRSTALRPEWQVDFPDSNHQERPPLPHADPEPSRQSEPIAGGYEQPVSVDDVFTLGVVALNARDFHEAVACFNQVLHDSPDDQEAYLHRGEAYLGLGDYSGAFEDACLCIELDPDDVDGFFLRGRALYHLEAYEDAAADFEYLIYEEGMGIEGVARKWRYQLWRGRVFVAEGALQEALRSFSRAINFAPLQIDPFIYRSRLYEHMGRIEESQADRETAFELNPEAAEREFGPK